MRVMSELVESTRTKDLSRIVIRFGVKSSAAPPVHHLHERRFRCYQAHGGHVSAQEAGRQVTWIF